MNPLSQLVDEAIRLRNNPAPTGNFKPQILDIWMKPGTAGKLTKAQRRALERLNANGPEHEPTGRAKGPWNSLMSGMDTRGWVIWDMYSDTATITDMGKAKLAE